MDGRGFVGNGMLWRGSRRRTAGKQGQEEAEAVEAGQREGQKRGKSTMGGRRRRAQNMGEGQQEFEPSRSEIDQLVEARRRGKIETDDEKQRAATTRRRRRPCLDAKPFPAAALAQSQRALGRTRLARRGRRVGTVEHWSDVPATSCTADAVRRRGEKREETGIVSGIRAAGAWQC